MTFDPVTKRVHFLNPAAVATPAQGTFGDCAVGAFDGPEYTTADLHFTGIAPAAIGSHVLYITDGH
jgi:hypothetical protein